MIMNGQSWSYSFRAGSAKPSRRPVHRFPEGLPAVVKPVGLQVGHRGDRWVRAAVSLYGTGQKRVEQWTNAVAVLHRRGLADHGDCCNGQQRQSGQVVSRYDHRYSRRFRYLTGQCQPRVFPHGDDGFKDLQERRLAAIHAGGGAPAMGVELSQADLRTAAVAGRLYASFL